jgi:hypothetical protein
MEVTELSYFEIWRKMFFYTVLSVFAISLCMLAFATILLTLSIIVDIFNLVVDPKRVWRSMRAMWYDQTPLLLSLLALVTACGLILVGQWYFEPAGLLAYHPGLGGY